MGTFKSTMEVRRHELDMVQVYKIVIGVGGVNSEQWLKMAENAGETRRMDPMNRVPAPWKNVPSKDCPGF